MSKVLVVGGGGREHALVKVLSTSPSHPTVIAAPGNAGIEADAEVVDVPATDVDGQRKLAKEREVDLVVVGPEAPLVLGLADRLREDGVPVLGPSEAASALEGSKQFAKQVMDEAGVPTARWSAFEAVDPALDFVRTLGGRSVVKADGLAAGKGVTVADSEEEAGAAIRAVLGGQHGEAGHRIVVEERLEGEELSVIALVHGEQIVTLAPSQDHKRAYDGDLGPNTGGMGAYSPAPRGTLELMRSVEETCLRPVAEVMAARGTPFFGVLYAGLMLTSDGPKVLEYNVRFGDPETQAILPRLREDAFELFLSVAEGRLVERPVEFSPQAAVTVVLAAEGYPASARKGDPIEGLDQADAMDGVTVFHAGTRRDGDRILTAGGRVLGVTALGDDLAAAVELAYQAVEKIRWPGMHYRKDIAHRALKR